MKGRAFLFLVALGVGAWFFHQHFEVHGLEHIRILRRNVAVDPDAGGDLATATPTLTPDALASETIRVASFNIQVFGVSKLKKTLVADRLAQVVRNFDVVAIQEVRAKSQDVLPNFIALVNATGRKYDYVIGPRLGRSSSKEQYAFVFDTETIEVDRSALYTVEDRDDQMHREPFVGCFRVRGPPPDQAYTFSLINIHTDPDETVQELNALDDVYRAVRNDGRGEDDIILLGDLNVNDQHLGQMGDVSGITWAISGVPTNTRGNRLYDNMLFTQAATTEFTGRAGVWDLLGELNLSMEEALELSDHMPIWAEFSVLEGGQRGRIASQPAEAVAR